MRRPKARAFVSGIGSMLSHGGRAGHRGIPGASTAGLRVSRGSSPMVSTFGGPHHRRMSDQTNTGTIPPSPAPGVRRLKRRLDHKVVAGVAAGLGEYFDLDPVLFRVGFVLLTVLGGAGILIYLAAWWLMPPDDAPAVGHRGTWRDHRGERVMRRLKGSPGWVGVGLLVIGGALLANDLGVRRPAVTWGVALIVLGVLMFRRGTDAATHEEVEPAPGAAAYGPAAYGPTSPGGTLPTPPPG